MTRSPQHTQPPTHCVLPSFGATVKRRGPWLSQFRGVKGSRASPGEGTAWTTWECHPPGRPITAGVGRGFLFRLAMAGPRVSLPSGYKQGCSFLPSEHPMGLRGPDFLPLYPGMSSGPSTPSLRVPCARCLAHSLGGGVSCGHALLYQMATWLPNEGGMGASLCVSLLTESTPQFLSHPHHWHLLS